MDKMTNRRTPATKPFLPGYQVKVGSRWWKIVAVGWMGERIYWLVNPEDESDVATFPACVVEGPDDH